MKEKLYKVIGFHKVGELEFPKELVDRKLTNPDAPLNNFAINVNYKGEDIWAVPIIFSKSDTYSGGEFFHYLQHKFVKVGKNKEPDMGVYDSEKAELLDVSSLKGFRE